MGMTLRSCEMDVRTGGKYHLNFGEGMDFFGRYIEVTPPSRIVWTNEEGGEDGSMTTVTFEEKGGQTLLIIASSIRRRKRSPRPAPERQTPRTDIPQLDELLATLS